MVRRSEPYIVAGELLAATKERDKTRIKVEIILHASCGEGLAYQNARTHRLVTRLRRANSILGNFPNRPKGFETGVLVFSQRVSKPLGSLRSVKVAMIDWGS
jgi:hypothetical protein